MGNGCGKSGERSFGSETSEVEAYDDMMFMEYMNGATDIPGELNDQGSSFLAPKARGIERVRGIRHLKLTSLGSIPGLLSQDKDSYYSSDSYCETCSSSGEEVWDSPPSKVGPLEYSFTVLPPPSPSTVSKGDSDSRSVFSCVDSASGEMGDTVCLDSASKSVVAEEMKPKRSIVGRPHQTRVGIEGNKFIHRDDLMKKVNRLKSFDKSSWIWEESRPPRIPRKPIFRWPIITSNISWIWVTPSAKVGPNFKTSPMIGRDSPPQIERLRVSSRP